MVKRGVLIFLAIVLALALIVGCGKTGKPIDKDNDKNGEGEGNGKDPGDDPKPVTIVISNWPKEDNQANIEIYAQHVQTMKEKYPYITIVGNEWGYDVNSFLPMAASGQLPNLYETFFTEASKIINAGYSADITDFVKSYGYDKAINPDLLALTTKGDKYYGLPSGGYSMGIIYNRKVFEEAGLLNEDGRPRFPKTYDELVQIAKEIKDKTGKPGFFFPTKSNQGGWMFMNVAWAFGAEFEKEIDGKWTAVFNSPEAVAALKYVRDLKWEHNVLPDNNLVDVMDMMGLIGTDQVGMGFGISDWTGEIIKHTELSKDDIAMSQVPEGPAGQAPVMGGGLYMFAPNSTPEQIDACIKWLEVIGYTDKLSDEALNGIEQTAKINSEEGLPVGPSGLRVWIDPSRLEAEDGIIKKYENVNMDLWSDYTENMTTGMRPEVPINAQELYRTLDAVIQSVLTDKDANIQKLLDDAVAEFQKSYLDKAE